MNPRSQRSQRSSVGLVPMLMWIGVLGCSATAGDTESGSGSSDSSTDGSQDATAESLGEDGQDGAADGGESDAGEEEGQADMGVEPDVLVLSERKAFPTAEGFGAEATGGRGGEILYVTTTQDTGEPGSLRWALREEYPRIIYFLVGGTFEVDSLLYVDYGNFTLAGETAHDLGGVNIRASGSPEDHRLYFSQVENFIVRYVSVEGGWEPWENDGTRHSSFVFPGAHNGIFDHYTGGWGCYTGGSVSKINDDVGRGGKVTTQRSLLHEGVSGHNVGGVGGIQMDFVRGSYDADQQAEKWAAWDGFTNHHNAFVGLTHRFYNTSGNGEIADQVYNNYIYGWLSRMSRHTNGNQPIDIYANVYEASLYNHSLDVAFMHKFDFNPYYNLDPPVEIQPAFYIEDNLIFDTEGGLFLGPDDDNWVMLTHFADSPYGNQNDPVDQAGRRFERSPQAKHPVTLTAPEDVKDDVLENCGAGVRFDADGVPYNVDPIDMRYLQWAREGIGPSFSSQSPGDGGLGDSASFVLPDYESLSRDPAELDEDGVPIGWEPPPDVQNDAGYSRLELYLAEIAGDFHMLRSQQ